MSKTLEDMWNECQIFSRDGAMRYPSYWSNALAGEAGEFANQIKKLDNPAKLCDREKLQEEFADIFIYWALMAKVIGWTIGDVITIVKKKLKEINK